MSKETQHEALYRRWRPGTFSEVIGQEHISKTLANAVKSGRVAHAYLFCGPRGTGKTSTARILAKALNCEEGPTPEPCGKCRSCLEIAEGSSLDVVEVDAASYRQVDETQEVLKGVHLAPAGDRRKIYIIDEVHMLSTHSFNALLKTLEEPPEHIVFVLATTEPHRVLPTVLSRCQRFDFHRVPSAALLQHMRNVSQAEKIDIADEALSLIVRRSQGGVRDALGALEQLAGFAGERRIDAVDATRLLGAVEFDVLADFVGRLDEGRVADALLLIHELSEDGRDARSFIAEILHYLRQLFLLQNAGEGALEAGDFLGEELETLKKRAADMDPGRTLAFLDAFGEAYEKSRGPDARLVLEISVVKLARPDSDSSVTGVLNRLDRLEAALAGREVFQASRTMAAPSLAEQSNTPMPTAAQPAAEEPREAGFQATSEKAPGVSGTAVETARDANLSAPSPSAEAPKRVEVSAAPPSANKPLAGGEFERIAGSWRSVLDRLRKKPAARACLMEAKPVALEGKKLVLEFGPSAEFHRSRVEKEYADVVATTIRAIADVEVSLDCRLGGQSKPKEPEPVKAERPLSAKEVAGFVVDEFDAKIVEESSDYSDKAPVFEEG